MTARRVWELFRHLVSDADRQRQVLVMKAYFDESGKSQPPVFVMAGFMARAEQWTAFDADWRAALNVPPVIEAFHMAEAVFPRDLFRLRMLTGIIKKHGLLGFAVTIHHEDYAAVFKGRISQRLDRPYALMYESAMLRVLQWLVEHNIDEQVDFVFDEQNEESDFLQSIHTPMMKILPEELRKRFGGRPIHADDVEVLPLQAADILAWMLRHTADRATCGLMPDEMFHGIFDDLWIDGFEFGRDQLEAIVTENRKRLHSRGEITDHEFNYMRRNLDWVITGFNHNRIKSAAEGQTIRLLAIPAKETKRFRLVRRCPLADSSHLHRKATDECLAERTTATP